MPPHPPCHRQSIFISGQRSKGSEALGIWLGRGRPWSLAQGSLRARRPCCVCYPPGALTSAGPPWCRRASDLSSRDTVGIAVLTNQWLQPFKHRRCAQAGAVLQLLYSMNAPWTLPGLGTLNRGWGVVDSSSISWLQWWWQPQGPKLSPGHLFFNGVYLLSVEL